eukprot:3894749-Rhodomonas_salina.1
MPSVQCGIQGPEERCAKKTNGSQSDGRHIDYTHQGKLPASVCNVGRDQHDTNSEDLRHTDEPRSGIVVHRANEDPNCAAEDLDCSIYSKPSHANFQSNNIALRHTLVRVLNIATSKEPTGADCRNLPL